VIRASLAVAMLLLPVVAEACPTCISSPFGDRTFGWAYLILFLVPFALAAVIGGVMIRVTGVGLSDLRHWLARLFHPAAREEETT
jgi:hypothetical protein